MTKVCVLMLGGNKQNECFWPSYYNCKSGYQHDLIVVHRNGLGLPENMRNSDGDLILQNKIDNNGNDIPHRAFGAYRHYFNQYKDYYDVFVFISDDVVLKRDNWLKDIVDGLSIHEMCGFGGSQIFNGGKRYPHESHVRAPFWFAKSEALKKTIWDFNHDHDGEMKIGDQITSAGYFGIQIGNKLDLGFDSTEPNHITQLIERKFFTNLSPFGKYETLGQLEELYNQIDKNTKIVSPYSHIREQRLFVDLEPFNGLIYKPSIDIARKYIKIKDIGFDINIVEL